MTRERGGVCGGEAYEESANPAGKASRDTVWDLALETRWSLRSMSKQEE